MCADFSFDATVRGFIVDAFFGVVGCGGAEKVGWR
jgi:hypothetical protein